MKFPFDPSEVVTPSYLYDLGLLQMTLSRIRDCIAGRPFKVHYAIKANNDRRLLDLIAMYGLGADCVSIGEVKYAIETGFEKNNVVFAGVAKTDNEITQALSYGIECIHVESMEELVNVDAIACRMKKKARIALRINPDIDAHTHHYITTGLAENKFGIDLRKADEAIRLAMSLENVELKGLHFHIGSQILTHEPFKLLCERINTLLAHVRSVHGVTLKYVNVGGGLGIDYEHPDQHPVSDFKGYFDTFANNLKLEDGQEVHFELGRSIVAQCGSLLTRVIYVKQGVEKKFVIVDGGMNNLIRPALYQAYHLIQNLSNPVGQTDKYDVVGPICESADVFAENRELPLTGRGDLLAIRSAGAYGQTMASHYNMRPEADVYYIR
ncbi:MAG: diaminopimelate decarboxylase [Muribaculaceae bacterium]|nr:diaminopimelate decarboxylase [Muribaculaceae bacterium]